MNKPNNGSYKRAFNDTINELFKSLNEQSLVLFTLGSFTLSTRESLAYFNKQAKPSP